MSFVVFESCLQIRFFKTSRKLFAAFFKIFTMNTLPSDVVVEILFHIHNDLDFCATAVNMACTNKFFSSVTASDLIWRNALNIFFKITVDKYDLGMPNK